MTQAELNLMFQERIDKLEEKVSMLQSMLDCERHTRKADDAYLERMIRVLESFTNAEIGYKAISS